MRWKACSAASILASRRREPIQKPYRTSYSIDGGAIRLSTWSLRAELATFRLQTAGPSAMTFRSPVTLPQGKYFLRGRSRSVVAGGLTGRAIGVASDLAGTTRKRPRAGRPTLRGGGAAHGRTAARQDSRRQVAEAITGETMRPGASGHGGNIDGQMADAPRPTRRRRPATRGRPATYASGGRRSRDRLLGTSHLCLRAAQGVSPSRSRGGQLVADRLDAPDRYGGGSESRPVRRHCLPLVHRRGPRPDRRAGGPLLRDRISRQRPIVHWNAVRGGRGRRWADRRSDSASAQPAESGRASAWPRCHLYLAERLLHADGGGIHDQHGDHRAPHRDHPAMA